jgi:hypothetical protein
LDEEEREGRRSMKGILLLVLGICFVASVAADAGNEINFVFSGMIPASAGSGGDGYQQSREEGYEVRELIFILSIIKFCVKLYSLLPGRLNK